MNDFKRSVGTLLDIPVADRGSRAVVAKDVKDGYLTFCRHHPGFDDAALRRDAEKKKTRPKATKGPCHEHQG